MKIGIYGGKIESKETLDYLLNCYNIKLEENIKTSDFEKTDIILIISRYNIGKIETRIGGITYYFEGDKRQDSFTVNVFRASKAVNTNCIYRNNNRKCFVWLVVFRCIKTTKRRKIWIL